jgi:hypothetical protein
MLRNVPIFLAIVVVVATGVVHGVWTNRWVTSHELEAAAARLAEVPKEFGNWTSRDQPFDTKEYARAGIVGGLMREYRNRNTGATVGVLIVCGRPGPISVHTPDACYRGAGYDPIAEKTHAAVDLDGAAASEFWWLRMKKQNTLIPEFLGIHYAWSPDGRWQAPASDPRLVFARYPFLYKLYVVRDLATPDGQTEAEQDRAFLQQFLPELHKTLFPTAA